MGNKRNNQKIPELKQKQKGFLKNIVFKKDLIFRTFNYLYHFTYNKGTIFLQNIPNYKHINKAARKFT